VEVTLDAESDDSENAARATSTRGMREALSVVIEENATSRIGSPNVVAPHVENMLKVTELKAIKSPSVRGSFANLDVVETHARPPVIPPPLTSEQQYAQLTQEIQEFYQRYGTLDPDGPLPGSLDPLSPLGMKERRELIETALKEGRDYLERRKDTVHRMERNARYHDTKFNNLNLIPEHNIIESWKDRMAHAPLPELKLIKKVTRSNAFHLKPIEVPPERPGTRMIYPEASPMASPTQPDWNLWTAEKAQARLQKGETGVGRAIGLSLPGHGNELWEPLKDPAGRVLYAHHNVHALTEALPHLKLLRKTELERSQSNRSAMQGASGKRHREGDLTMEPEGVEDIGPGIMWHAARVLVRRDSDDGDSSGDESDEDSDEEGSRSVSLLALNEEEERNLPMFGEDSDG
jgi:hypothetical protein